MSKVHLKVCLYTAPDHAQKCMKDLGITYQAAVPQSLYDSWWFFNCENVPVDLPEWLTVFDVDPMKCIGNGLSLDEAEAIVAGSV